MILLLLSGEKIGELTHEEIENCLLLCEEYKEDWVFDIALKNGKVLLACGGGGILLFNLA